MFKFKKVTLGAISVGLAACFSTSIVALAINKGQETETPFLKGDAISRFEGSIDKHTADFFDENVVHRLSDSIGSNQEISVILSLNTQSTLDAYLAEGSKGEFSDYLATSAAQKLVKENRAAGEELRKTLDKAKISYKMGVSYENVLSGFEVTLRAKEYNKLVDAVSGKATPIVGEVYAPAVTEVVTNEVKVYETGIFDSSSSEYKGDGVVVAVLDTGLDYTHSAFSTDNFESTNKRFTLETVSKAVNSVDQNGKSILSAAKTTANLEAEDLYVSEKVPFAYDYADKDVDVLPLSSEHGTHVAGVIAGKDDVITGVAPNAQLAIMKVFSDGNDSGARSSWMIAALDDCVALGVDVINMSLGSPAGFTTQEDKKEVKKVYDSIRAAGISLITAGGNENNAVTGSDKNGSNPLTRNPDAGTVGSPSTYEAALSVASVDGVKTPYFLFGDDIIYFNEASDSSAKPKNFVNEILSTVGTDSHDFEYVTISGVGRRSDYTESKSYYNNKIVLVKRGDTTFEEKVDIALRIMGAAGIIIYNNVSGSISMTVGSAKGAVCSIAQDDGEKLAANKTGIIKISKSQVAGPFMSDFSSWGPTSDLRIKPEITAHGGEIYSAIPGQKYDRMSGTSMAAPNMAGAAALIRQYVKANPDAFGLSAESSQNNNYAIDVTKRVNQLAMSTADIVKNKNGLVYAVRKQGAGLVNIEKATTSEAYISTFQNGVEMDKTKLELGDDKDKTGVYEMTFAINNIKDTTASYEIGSIVLTEGVSPTLTSHGDTTITTDGYLLNPSTSIVGIDGDGSTSGSVVTVSAHGSAKVTVKITLSEEDKNYLNDSFEYGMYVEGFITLKATSGTSVNLSVPFLTFYGDWTEAPIFDEEYYDTHADEINNGIDPQDKLMADAYATRVIGGTYSDYISVLGEYPFKQDPSATQIAANRDRIALSNYETGDDSASLSSLNSIAAGLLRNVKEWKLTIVEDSTGKTIWTKVGQNQRKSVSSGISVYQSSMEVDFSVLEHNLKNNTKYTVTVETFIDWDKSEQKNARNTFSFPLYIDFEAPVVTGVEYRTEYDKSAKKTHLYADVSIYDNHYAAGVVFGQVVAPEDPDSRFLYSLVSFGKYMTPVYSSYNSTTKVTFELTDYIKQIKNSIGKVGGEDSVKNNSFIATCYDYAMNEATYEIRIPDEVLAMRFTEEEIKLNPNETLDLTTVLEVFPADTWLQIVDFEVTSGADAEGNKLSKTEAESIVGIVNQTVIAKETGKGKTATITATGKNAKGEDVKADIDIYVRSEGDAGYRKYDAPLVNKASISQYHTEKAYYDVSSSEREIGYTGGTYNFGRDYTLSMFPSESVTLICDIDSYFYTPDELPLKYTSSNTDIVTVNEDGTIVARAKGSAIISVNLEFEQNGKTTTYFVGSVDVTVKDPFNANSIYLLSYKGNGGRVVIPDNRGITTIQSYAFSNYEYVEKDTAAGDVINDEDPFHLKQMYIGENTITSIVIPEGVTTIEAYAFAKLTALEEVKLPTTLTKIGVGAFFGCYKLNKINLENVQFINEHAFDSCYSLTGKPDFSSVVAIGAFAFANTSIVNLVLPESAQSLDSGAFYNCPNLTKIEFKAKLIKIGASVFEGCTGLYEIKTNNNEATEPNKINAVVISERAFYGCTNSNLNVITIGEDVAVIGQNAFSNANISEFKVAEGNKTFVVGDKEKGENEGWLYKKVRQLNEDEEEVEVRVLALAPSRLPIADDDSVVINLGNATMVESGAFTGNRYITKVIGENVMAIDDYAFADCPDLVEVYFPNLMYIGDYAFFNDENLTFETTEGDPGFDPFENVFYIGEAAFAGTAIKEVKIADGADEQSGVIIGDLAFLGCSKLEKVTIGDYAEIGEAAFFMEAENQSFEAIGNMSVFNDYYVEYDYPVDEETTYTYLRYNFAKCVKTSLTEIEIGEGVYIGSYAFRNAAKVKTFSIGADAMIDAYAFYDATGVSIDVSQVLMIGEGAFMGSRYRDYRVVHPAQSEEGEEGEDEYYNAFEYDSRGNRTGYKYSYTAPSIKSMDNGEEVEGLADLSNVLILGEGAFLNNQSLTEAILPEYAITANGLSYFTEIPAYTFANCYSLGFVWFPTKITSVGEYAFANTSAYNVKITDQLVGDMYYLYFGNCNIEYVGEAAFLNSMLFGIKFAKDAEVCDQAFAGCEFLGPDFYVQYYTILFKQYLGVDIDEEMIEGLEEKYDYVVGLENIDKIGSLAFYKTGLRKINLAGTTEIGDFAFALSGVTEVTLGKNLKTIGANPFLGCEMNFAKQKVEVSAGDDRFPDFTVEVESDTYDINKSFKVIGGVLYEVVPKGLELVCYPGGLKDGAYTVEEGTVRIGASAFQATPITNVTLPASLKAIGDKAFYECEKLTTVIFKGMQAPILEEEYDASYAALDNLPFTGQIKDIYGDTYEGLGIADYYMWNFDDPCFYYGANFVDYIGHFGATTPKLVLVSPANGTGYDTFIFNQYFDTHIAGSSVATEDTLAVIEMIAKLSSSISLKDEAAVEAARRAFDALPNLEQQALVTNYTKLTNAEKTIAYLKANEPTTDTPVTPGVEEGGSVNALGIAGFTIAGVLLLALAAFAVYFFLGKKKAKASAGYFESTKTVNEESESTETTDADEAEEASETDDASEEDKADDNDDE